MPSSSALRFTAASDGVRIAYLTVGAGSPVVFASNIFGEASGYQIGWPFTKAVADGLADRGWLVVLFDHRGMASSDRDVADLSLDARVRDLTAVVDAVGLEKFALVAVDNGAPTAITYAVAHAAAITRLVLLSPWASGARYFAQPALRAALSADAGNDHERRLFAQILSSVALGFEDSEFIRFGTEAHLRVTTAAEFAAFNDATARIDVTRLLARVTVPTLVTHESPFPFGSFGLCQEVAAGIPCAEFVTVAQNSIAGRVHDENITLIDRFLRAGTVAARHAASARRSSAAPAGLSPRELEVLGRVATGATNKAIAADLGIAESTIERHLVNLYNKIGARGRADAIRFALRHGVDGGRR